MGFPHEHLVQLEDFVAVDASFASHYILSLYWPVQQKKGVCPVRAPKRMVLLNFFHI